MAITNDLGWSGLETRYGRPSDDFLTEWTGDNKVKKITEMLKNSAPVGALRMAIEMPVRQIDWTFSSEDGDDDPRLDLLRESLANLSHSWNDHIVSALLFPHYGWSMFTLNYERVGGRLLWRKFKELGQETVWEWHFDMSDGGLLGLTQKPHLVATSQGMIPIERMLIYRFRYNRNHPEGESMLRPAYIPYYFASNMQQTEAISLERIFSGMPVITPPMNTDMTVGGTNYNAAHATVRNIRNDEQAGVVMPAPVGEGENDAWKLELLSTGGGTGLPNMGDVISRYEKRILTTALAQFIILGQDKVGALSLSTDQTNFFQLALNAVADIIAETFTRFAIPRLMELNGLDAAGLQLDHSPAGDTDLGELGEFLQKVMPNLTWDAGDEVWLRSVANLPDKTVEQVEEQRLERAEAAAAIRATQPAQLFPPRDDNAAELFVSDNAPDDDERRKNESMWKREVSKFFAGQKGRVERASAKARRDLRQFFSSEEVGE